MVYYIVGGRGFAIQTEAVLEGQSAPDKWQATRCWIETVNKSVRRL